MKRLWVRIVSGATYKLDCLPSAASLDELPRFINAQYDIDAMRNGSLGFDLMTIGKTLAVVWRDQNAY